MLADAEQLVPQFMAFFEGKGLSTGESIPIMWSGNLLQSIHEANKLLRARQILEVISPLVPALCVQS